MLHLPSTEKYALAEPSTTVSGRTSETGSDVGFSGIKTRSIWLQFQLYLHAWVAAKRVRHHPLHRAFLLSTNPFICNFVVEVSHPANFVLGLQYPHTQTVMDFYVALSAGLD